MNEPFDPYYTWLGIPPHEQPANFYRLLGIQLFEPNQRVIDNAADRQMMLLRSFQNGPNSGESQRLLNEVSAARGCLLDPQKRTAYDHQLGQLNASRASAIDLRLAHALPPAQRSATVVSGPTPTSPVATHAPNAPARPSTSRPSRPVSSRPSLPYDWSLLRHIVQIVVGGVAGLALAIFSINYFVGTDILGWSARSRKQTDVTEKPQLRSSDSSPSPKPSRPTRSTKNAAPQPTVAASPLFGNPITKPDEPPRESLKLNPTVAKGPNSFLAKKISVINGLEPGSSISSVAYSYDGNLLALGDNKTVKVWDVAAGAEKVLLFGAAGRINSLAFSHDGTSLGVRMKSCGAKMGCLDKKSVSETR